MPYLSEYIETDILHFCTKRNQFYSGNVLSAGELNSCLPLKDVQWHHQMTEIHRNVCIHNSSRYSDHFKTLLGWVCVQCELTTFLVRVSWDPRYSDHLRIVLHTLYNLIEPPKAVRGHITHVPSNVNSFQWILNWLLQKWRGYLQWWLEHAVETLVSYFPSSSF